MNPYWREVLFRKWAFNRAYTILPRLWKTKFTLKQVQKTFGKSI